MSSEPSFIPPESPGLNSGNGRYNQLEDEEASVFADKHEAAPRPYSEAAPRPYSGYAAPSAAAADSAMARPSVDAYGAFDGDMPGAMHHASDEPSRTMQMAYQDPCKSSTCCPALPSNAHANPT